jgi:hypothetical protein
MPLLFQRAVGLESRPISISGVRDLLADALANSSSSAGRSCAF